MILVVGATGMLGGMIASSLEHDGKKVRALVRDSSDVSRLGPKIERIQGDMKDPASLHRACRGISTVITTANAAQRVGPDTFDSVDVVGNRNLIEAARTEGVRHFIFTSALGASKDNPNPLFQAKALAEERLRSSGMKFTILAPEPFMEVWIGLVVGMPLSKGQPVTLVGEGKRKHSFISARDVASFAVKSVNNPKAENAFLPLGGPHAVCWREILTTYEGILGKQIPVKFVPMGSELPGLPPAVVGLMNALETFDSPVDMTDMTKGFGVRLTSVEEFAKNNLATGMKA